jgi:hypothetical protein
MSAAYRTALAAVGPLAVAVAFGTAARLLTLEHSSFLAAVGGLTAPWLLLPFLVGAARPRREGNALLGIACVWLAIVACSAGAESGGGLTGPLTPERVLSYPGTFLLSHLPVLLGASVSGPVYAVLGHWLRVSRSWLPALAATAPLMVEPAARWLASQSVLFWADYPPVAWAETLTGLALTAAAIVVSANADSARVWPGRPRRNGLRGLLACLVCRTTAIAGIAVVAVAVIVFCAPPVFPQVYPAANGTAGVVVTPDGRTAYVGNYAYNDDAASFPSVAPTLTPVDLATMRTGRPIVVAPSGWSIDYGLLPPDGGTFYAVVGLNGQSDAEVAGIQGAAVDLSRRRRTRRPATRAQWTDALPEPSRRFLRRVPPSVRNEGFDLPLAPGSGRVRIWQALDRAVGDRPDQLCVVPLVLVGVQPGEPAELGRELGPFPDVAVDGHRVAAPGVGPGQCLTAGGGELE